MIADMANNTIPAIDQLNLPLKISTTKPARTEIPTPYNTSPIVCDCVLTHANTLFGVMLLPTAGP
ncbi:MAG: hypothetical protein LBP89_10135 [Helicobacteraceae bacterium]|nr:hypothetical protein [Helicobacteraceae bacterium]